MQQYSQEQKQKRSYYSVLVELALVDQDLSVLEKQRLIDRAEELYVTDAEVAQLLNGEKVVEFVPPATQEESFFLLYDLVKMMMTDGLIHRKEMAFCKAFAARQGFKPYVCDTIVPAMVTYVMNNSEVDVAMKAIMDPSYWPDSIRVSS